MIIFVSAMAILGWLAAALLLVCFLSEASEHADTKTLASNAERARDDAKERLSNKDRTITDLCDKLAAIRQCAAIDHAESTS